MELNEAPTARNISYQDTSGKIPAEYFRSWRFVNRNSFSPPSLDLFIFYGIPAARKLEN